MKPRRRLFATRVSLPFLTAIAALFAASHAHSQIVWAGATANVASGAWGTTTNWTGGNVPDTNTEIASFSANWSGTGPTFALGADRTVNGVIYEDTGTTGDQAGSIVAGSTLTLGGTTPKITTTNSLTISSTLGWGAAGFAKDGPVTLTLSGGNTGTGPVTLSAGIIRATNNAAALGTGAATLSLAASTTLQLANDTALSFARNTTVAGNATITSDRLNAGAGVTHTLGTLSIGAQTLTVTRGSNATSGTGGVTFGATTMTGNATFSPAANAQLNLGAVGGSFSLTQNGAGVTVLSAAGTYTGATTVTAGTLRAGNATAFGTTAGGVSIASGAVVDLNGVAIGAEAFTLNGTGISSGGALINSSGTGASLSGTISLASNSSVGGNGAGTLVLSGVVSGTGTLTKVGSGTVRLTGNNTFANGVTIQAGTLELQTSAAAAGTGTILLGDTAGTAAATLLGGSSITHTNPITVQAGSSGVKTINTYSAANTAYSGLITLNAPLTVSNTGTGSNGMVIGVTNSANTSINLNSNTLTIANTNTGRVFIDGVMTGTGSVVINNTSTGDYIPRGDHNYSGGTTLTAGNVAVDRDSLGTPGSPTSGAFGTGTLIINGGQMRSGTTPVAGRSVGNAVTLGGDTTFYTTGSEKDLTFTGPVTISGASRTITSNVGTTVAGKSAFFTGAIGDGGNALGLIKAGAGNLTLGGTNTYTGGTTVNAGSLILTGSLDPASAFTVNPTVAGGAVINFISGAANPMTSASAVTLNSTTGPVSLRFELGANTAGSDSITTSATATTTGIVNIAVQALAGFGGASTYDLITAAGGLNGATYVLTNAPGGFNYSLNTSGTLMQLGVAPTTAGDIYWRGDTSNSWSALSGTNSNWYSNVAGTTNAQANPGAGDTVNFSTVNAITAGGVITTSLDNNFTVNDLVFGDNPNGVTSVTIAGGTTPGGVAGVLSIAPSASGDGVNVGSNAGSVTISAPVQLGAAQTWSVDGTGANGSALTVSGALSGSAALTINGLVTLSAGSSSTHTGTTTVLNGAILQGGAANSFSAGTAVAVNGTGIVRLNGFNNRAATLTGTGTVQNNHSSTGATLSVGDASNFTFAGTLQNGAAAALGLTKVGTGALTLTGTNTYTGATTITEGTIAQGAAGALPAGTALTVNGTSLFDLNGADASVSTLGGVATAFVTDNAAGSGTSTLSITAAGTSAVNINDGATRDVALRITNSNGSFQLTNGSNTFSGGIVLTNSLAGTRISPGTITAGAYGSGAITIGEAPSDKAGIFFATAGQTLANPIIFNTALGTDRVGIRTDVAGITLSGVITANLAPATFTANTATAGAFTLTNQVTGASGLVLDITSLSASATAFLVTLNNATINANNYQGDTVINFNPASGKSATLEVAAADQIPNGVNAGNVFVNANGTGVGTLRVAGVSETINGLNGSGNVVSTSGTVTLTLGDNNATASHSGVISNTAGTLSVTKIGSGIQTLSGASTFSGALNVNGGLVAFPSSPATAGPLGNSTGVNLSGGGISYTAAGANNLNRTAAVLGSTGTVDVANATGALSFAATSTGGDLVKTGPGAALLTGSTELNLIANGAGVVVSDGTLQAGFGVTDVATVTVGSTGNLNLTDSAAEALTLDASSGALTLDGGAQLGFEVNAAASDSIAVAAGGTAVTSGVVTLNLFNTGAGIQTTTYTLLTADSGLNGATYALGAAPSGFNYTINATATAVTLTVTAELPVYWRDGQVTGLWSTLGSGPANWTSDAAGTVDAASTPLSGNAVIFSATGATAASTLDAAFTVDSLRFANTHTITASGPGALTLNPASTSGGLRVLSGGLTATISAPLTTGAAQTWDVDATGSLIISGNTVFNANVTKTNTGALTLSGTNSGTGAITLAGGTLNLNSATALGGGLFTIGAGTTINTPAGAIALTTNNAQSWNGDFTFTGANNLDLGTGAVTLGNSVAINTAGSTLTVGGAIGDGGNNRGLTKAGTGTIVLNSANSYGGLTTINAGVLRITNGAGLGTTVAGTTQSGTSALELDGTGGDITLGAEALTINGGGITDLGALRNIAGNNTYGGTVTMGIQSRINSDSGTLTLSNPTAVSATNLNLIVGGAGNLTISGAIATGTGGVAKDGAGVLTLSGTNTYTGSTTVNGGILNITGSISGLAATTNLAYGGTAGKTIVNISGSGSIANYKNFQGANVAGSIAVMNQTGGSTSTLGTNGADTQWVAQNGGYGCLNITGGTFNTGRFDAVGATGGGTAVVYVGGGGTLNNNSGDWFILPRKNGVGQLTAGPGGSLVRTAAATSPLGITMDASNAHGALNIAGGNVDTGVRAIQFGFGTTAFTGSRGFVNLAGGTLSVGSAINQTNSAAGSSYSDHINFAGGTLKSNAAMTWLPAASLAQHTLTATIYGPVTNNNNANTAFNTQIGASSNFTGGLTVDTNGFATTIAYPLSVAGGVGVTQADIGDVSLLSGNSGYIGAPSVVFSAPALPTGVPASGYAVVDNGTGKVSGIIITNPGTYAASETPTITLTGGGGTIAPFATAALATANTSGGLTKSGLGTLTLSGANTYTGATLVSGGALQLNGNAAPLTMLATSGVTVEAAGTLGFTAAAASTLDLTGKDMTLSGGTLAFDIGDAGVNDSITVNNFALTANSAFSFTSIGAIGGSYILVNSATPITNAGPYTISGQTIGRVTLTPTVDTNTITVDSTVFEGKWALTGGGNWSLGDPNATLDNWLNYKPTVLGDAALFGDTITAPSTVAVDTPHIAGYLRFDNANAYTIGANGSSNLTLNNGTSNAVTTVTTGSHTIAENVALLSHLDVIPAAGTTLTMSGVVSGATRNLEVNGPGALVLSGVNTYGGTTTVSNGTLTLSGARTATMGAVTVGNLSSTTGTLNVSAGTFTTATFSVGSGTGSTTAGIVNHTGGTLTMSGSQLLLGNGGTGLLPGSNSTGTYNLNGGTLNTATGLGVLIGTNTGATGVFNLSSGTLSMPATSTMQIARSDNSAALATTGTFSQTGGTATVGILQMSGIAAGAANNASGSSTLTLTGGTFTAATFNALSGGNGSSSTITIGGSAQVTLPVFPTNAKGTSATATITFDSTTGFLSPAATSATYLPAGTFTNAYLTANGANLNIPTGRDITITQMLADAPTFVGTLTKSGVGTLTLSAANTYTGLTTVNAGTINLGNIDALGTTAAGTTVASGGRVTFGTLTTASIVAEPFGITGTGTASNGALNVGGNKTINLSGAITLSGNASVSADGGSAFNFTSASGITGTDTNFAFQTDGSVANSITGPISLGAGSLTKSGNSTLILSGDNTYSGGTTISGGILAIPSTGDAGTGDISIAGAVRLELGAVTLANTINLGANATAGGRGQVEGINGITTLSGPISVTVAPVAGGTFATTGAGTLLNLNGTITATPSTVPVSVRLGNVNFGGGGNYTDLRISGNVGLNADDGISTSAVTTVGASLTCVIDLRGFDQSLAGMIKGGSTASVVNSAAATTGTLTLTSTVSSTNAVVLAGSGAGTLAVTQAGSAVQTLSGVNTYTGPTTVTSGTLAAGVASVANVSGAFGKNSAVIMADEATAILDITGFNTQIGSLTGGGAIGGNVNLGAAVLNVGGDNTSPAAYAGAIAGTGALTKIGTGTQVLSGANSYNGNTTVSAGTLALVGGSQASAITVGAGASLGFTLNSPTTSTSTFDLTAGTIKITGTPTLPSYPLISSSTGITGTPVLHTPIAGYILKKVGNTLVLENPYAVWAAANGATGGPTGDPDGDGLENLLEYAFGTNPTVSSTGPLAYSGGVLTATGQPILEEDAGIYYAVFGRRTDYLAAGLIYTVEFSNALSAWTPTGTAPTILATDGVIDVVRVPFLNIVPSPSGPQKPTFFHVEVSQ